MRIKQSNKQAGRFVKTIFKNFVTLLLNKSDYRDSGTSIPRLYYTYCTLEGINCVPSWKYAVFRKSAAEIVS